MGRRAENEGEDKDGGAVRVRTLYGPVPMEYARHWPVLTAYDDLAAYAAQKGGRIPSEAELRLTRTLQAAGLL